MEHIIFSRWMALRETVILPIKGDHKSYGQTSFISRVEGDPSPVVPPSLLPPTEQQKEHYAAEESKKVQGPNSIAPKIAPKTQF